MDDVDPKLLKIVALAKHGIGGEKETAIELVKKMCEREGIDFDELMSDHSAPREYSTDIKLRGRDELQVAIQVVARFATSPEHPDVRGGYYSYDKSARLRYTTTPARHIDTLNAISVYLTAYRKEKRKFLKSLNTAFYSHHHLFSQFDESSETDEPKPEKTKEELQDEWRAMQMMEAMTEQVNLTKQIGDGDVSA